MRDDRRARERQLRLARRRARLEQQRLAHLARRRLRTRDARLATARTELDESAALYRELFTNNPLPLYVVDRQTTRFLEMNRATTDHYEFSRDELLEMTLRDIEPVSELAGADARRAALSGALIHTGVWRHVTRTGRSLEVELSIHPIAWHGTPAWLIVARDVTQQRSVQRTLDLQTRAMEASHNGMFIVSAAQPQGAVVYLNSAMAHLMRRSRQALMGCSMADLFACVNAREVSELNTALQTRSRSRAVVSTQGAEGENAWLEIQVTAVPDEAGETAHWIGVVQDITEQKRFEATLAYRAGHDMLTGLPNRETAARRLAVEIEQASLPGGGGQVAVLFLDIDDFKKINDLGGLEAGDIYLKGVAARLADRIRRGDMLARVGGDEFVLISRDNGSSDQLLSLADRLHEVFAVPIEHRDQALASSVSIGIACFPDHGHDAETLLRRADLTMHMAKRLGGRATEWFSGSLERQFRQRGLIESQLRETLAARAFALHYQPQINLQTQRIFGVEALLRWPDADLAFANPAVFIPVAEETGLIREIGRWVLEQACHDLAHLRATTHPTLTMAINVSVEQLRDPGFTDIVAAVLTQHALPPDALEIEVTESVCMSHYVSAVHTLHALHAYGIKLAIDDFGTGYSSLSYLSRLPIHRLKIDRSFVNAINESPRSSELVRMLTSLARNLGVEPLAEGVETDLERRALVDYECPLAQGYLFGRPVPLDVLRPLLASNRSACNMMDE
ncbi:bifunctional diguanylate cyclase/phosphodiesterase [Salinisphaera sp. Q1T1-3]|uniref:putative bifunctional diguanylate cyclase/phosphodiesterase n=1 Tax=Salinisphaera sp. Q1T1-3 TaxID=2321229 RepID=UPI000E72BB1A|nr:EAL domain-containing protein [Salinisphaera sp. Q1T1-3]RJS93257.1 phosphodiesterase [Salinisphaera sp. Q1T1-3]